MPSLDQWFAREQRREAYRTTVDDAIVFGRFHRYVWQRSRRFLLTRLVQEVLHVGELYLLFIFASQEVFLTAAALTFATRLATSGYWGALEVLRAGVRERSRDGRAVTIGPWVHRWVRSTATIGAGLSLGVLGVAGVRVVSGMDVAQAYVTVWLIGFAVDLPVRAFHAGAYALRRVYQPTWSLLAPTALRALTLALLWPVIGIWSVVPAAACTIVATAILTTWFTRQTYRDLDLWPLARVPARIATRLVPGGPHRVSIVLAAFGGASITVGHALGLAILSLASANPQLWLGVFAYLLLAAPLAEACVAWTRLFYPDLARLESELFAPYRDHLERRLIQWSPIVGLALWAPTLAIVGVVPGERPEWVAILTLLLFVVRARLAAFQLVAFSNRRFGYLIVVSLAAALTAVALSFLDGLIVRWLLVAILAGGCFLRPPPPVRRLRGLIPLPTLIAGAHRLRGQGSWILSEYRPGWLLHGPALLLNRTARHSGVIGIDRQELLLRWRPQRDRPGEWRDPFEDVQGRRWHSPTATATEALRPWIAHWPAGDLPAPVRIADVVREFQSHFPDGICLEHGLPTDPRVYDLLTWRERQAVLDEIAQFALGGPPTAILPVDVSAVMDRGRVVCVFLVPRDALPAARRRWRRWVRQASLANALAAADAAVSEDRTVAPRARTRRSA